MSETTSFLSQFGEKLVKPLDSTELTPADAISGKDHIMLYFSAHWCPPCRRFTPILIELYKKLKTKHNVELIFCSLDRSENEYKEYVSDMPWVCMPFDAPESKVLAKKYKASGIPHLVVVDASGNIVTKDGTSEVDDDAEGKNFPWKPKSFAEVWPANILVKKGVDGSSNDDDADVMMSSSALKDKHLMLYFSASWCPPCQAFTPKLSKAYTKLKSLQDNVELVFVSSDRDEDSFNEYHKKMSFPALPFEHRDAKAALSKMFDVSGIPKLLMLGPADEDGNRPLVNDNVRGHVESESYEEFPFPKTNYGDVGSAELNEMKSLIVFHENGDDDEQSSVKEVIKAVAAKFKAKKENETSSVNFHWAFSNGGIAPKIREVTGLPTADKSEDPVMIMLDIPNEGGYYKSDDTDITVETIMAFVESPGERSQLS